MSNASEWLKKNTSVNCTGMRHTQLFHGETHSSETSLLVKGTNTRLPNFNSSHLRATNQHFKVPQPVRKASVKSCISPRRRVQIGRIKNDLKINPKMKMSFLPHPSLMNPRKTLLCARTNHINSRKEVIQKMILLGECSQLGSRGFQRSTPVKLPTGLTPRKTPQSKGYLSLPEFKKMGLKVDMGTPLQDIVRQNPSTPHFHTLDQNKNDFTKDNNSKVKVDLECFSPDKTTVFNQILHHCRTYTKNFNFIYGKLELLEDSFESQIKNTPDYLVYDAFCHYSSEKDKLYSEFKQLEEKFRNSVKNQTQVGKKLKEYLEVRGELFKKQTALHKKFEAAVESLWEKSLEKPKEQENKEREEENKENKKNDKEEIKKSEIPQLRRSLRLSKKNKHKEKS